MSSAKWSLFRLGLIELKQERHSTDYFVSLDRDGCQYAASICHSIHVT